jgi:hypothetical protein
MLLNKQIVANKVQSNILDAAIIFPAKKKTQKFYISLDFFSYKYTLKLSLFIFVFNSCFKLKV